MIANIVNARDGPCMDRGLAQRECSSGERCLFLFAMKRDVAGQLRGKIGV